MLAGSLLTACAASPPQQAKAPEIVRLDVDSTLALLRDDRDEGDLLASGFSVGVDEDLLRYEASYSLDRGDFLQVGEPLPGAYGTPTRFLGQQIGQNVQLRLPELAGSPLTLGVSSELSNEWLVSGYSQSQQQQAGLEWSPGPALVDVTWSGAGTAYDASTALTCNLESSVRLPTHEAEHHSEGVLLSGAACAVSAADTAYAGLATRAFGVGYVWDRPHRSSEAVVSVIDPVWTDAGQVGDLRRVEPGYELDLSHRREFGALSTETVVSLRRPPGWEAAATDPSDPYTVEPAWTTSTSLTWNLPYASLSASWANGVDPLWFTPDVGARSDSFGLALNLSRWMAGLVPGASPKLAMNWNWSQLRLPDEGITGNNALRLDLALMF